MVFDDKWHENEMLAIYGVCDNAEISAKAMNLAQYFPEGYVVQVGNSKVRWEDAYYSYNSDRVVLRRVVQLKELSKHGLPALDVRKRYIDPDTPIKLIRIHKEKR